jgi:hypothetical protein
LGSFFRVLVLALELSWELCLRHFGDMARSNN